jgi:hypothetical protein
MIYVPTLSEDGWVSDGKSQGAYLFAHLFESNYSQSSIYKGNISSLAYVFAMYPEDPDHTMSLLQNMLQTYYGRYFSDVTVEIKQQPDPNNTAQVAFYVYLAYTDNNGEQQTLANIIDTTAGNINNVIKVNNTGSF